MGSISDYQKRARQCSERAQIVNSPVDRARWRQLADEWSALSRMTIEKTSVQHSTPAESGRGNILSDQRQRGSE